MRFNSLQIPAFGPFTQFELQFDKSNEDLHLIYGANEAGKSSLLRAIHNLLYGIPARSDDNFLHAYGKLLIGATVSDGRNELSFLRKKGNQGTLLDTNQNSIDEGQLKAFCGSVNDEFFTHMFGLSTSSLRTGAEKLLSGEGELGTLLFSASLGGSPIDAALERLQEEADQLFAGNGRKANAIVIAYKAFKEFEKESRELSTTAHAWSVLQKSIKAAEDEFEGKEKTLQDYRHRALHLKNLIQAIPLVSELKHVDEQLTQVTLPELPSDFAERVRKAQGDLSNARSLCDADALSLKGKQEKRDTIPAYDTIIEEASDIDSLHQGIAHQVEAIGAHSEMEETRHQLRQQLEKQVKDLGLESASALTGLPVLRAGDVEALEELADLFGTKVETREQAQANLEQTTEELTEAEDKLDALGEVEVTPAIRDLASRIEEHAQDFKVAASQIDSRKDLTIQLQQAARQLGLEDLEATEIRKLPVPALALLEELHEERNALLKKREASQETRDGLDKKVIEKKADIEQTSGNIAVYTDEDLARVRKQRDTQWAALAAQLKKGTAAAGAEVEALTESIQKSDEIADALRNHAEILGKLATLNHDLDLLANQSDHEAQIIERLDGELAEWTESWAEKSQVLAERDFLPAELIEWRTQWESWCDIDSRLTSLEEKIEAHRHTEVSLLEELRQHFDSPRASYRVLSRQLTDAIEAASTAKGERKVLNDSIATLTKKKARQAIALNKATEALQETRKKWHHALVEHQLDDPGSPKAALATLQARREARETYQAIEDATGHVKTLADQMTNFQQRLGKQRDKHLPDAPELDPKNPGLTEARLWKILEEARQNQTKHNSLVEEIEDLETSIQAKQGIITAAEKEIDALIAEAKLNSADELSAAITQFEKRKELTNQREAAHRTLVHLAGSSPVESLIDEAEASERNDLQAELEQLAPKIEALQQERDESRDRLNKEIEKRSELEKAKGGAIDAKQRAANALAKVVTDSERFIRLHHAIAFLKAQVDAYREKSQGPMIEKTGKFFATLTNGSFAGVAAQADENDPNRVNLVALRQNANTPGGIADTLHTTALSEGTRDQLYLALRLAAIDIHLENHAPMPLILDDILMTFDDERAESVFRVLKTLSKKTQVIVFTHHQHIAKLAATLIPKEHLLKLPEHQTVDHQS